MSMAEGMHTQHSVAASRGSAIFAAALHPQRLQANAVRLATVLLILSASLAMPGFASSSNLAAIMYSMAAVGIAAVGMALITLSGNLFMLSMGATAAVSTIMFASFLYLGLFPAVLIVLACGALLGLIQGIVVGYAKANPIISSIAMASIITGFGSLYSGGLTIVGDGDASWLAIGNVFFNIPNQVVLFVLFTVLMSFIVDRTRFGRELRLTGLNPVAAEFAGMRVGRALMLAYVFAAASAAFAGALYASQAAQGNLRLGAGLDFDAIAAVLVGGIAIKGGRGRIMDAAVGAVFLSVISNILLIAGLPLEIQLIVKGLVVIASVMLGAIAMKFGNAP